MSGPNLIVERDSLKLLDETNDLQRLHNGSYAWGIDPEDLGLIRLLARGENNKIAARLDEATKRKLISFIKYYPLSDDPDRPDYVDFLAGDFLDLLIEYSIIEQGEYHPLTSAPDRERLIPVNDEPQIRARLSRLLEKEEFSKSHLDYLSKAGRKQPVASFFDLQQLPQTVKESYVQQNRQDKLKRANRNPLMISLKPFLSWLPWMITRWLFGATMDNIAANLNTAPAPIGGGSHANVARELGAAAEPPASPSIAPATPRAAKSEPPADGKYSPPPQDAEPPAEATYSPAPPPAGTYSAPASPAAVTYSPAAPGTSIYSPAPGPDVRSYSPPPGYQGPTVLEFESEKEEEGLSQAP